MDGNQFDTLAKALAGLRSRRETLRALTALPLGGLLISLGEETSEAGNRRQRHRHRGQQTRGARRQDVAAKRKRKQKHKKKPCAQAGQAPWNSSVACCSGLALDGSGVCSSATLLPSPPLTPCAGHCNGCCAGETCRAGTGRRACGTGGGPCAKCVAPAGTCIDGACVCDVCPGGGCPFATIEAALVAAGDRATITICPGRYSLTSTLIIDQNVSLIGAGAGLDPRVATIIDATGANLTAVAIDHNRSVVLRNLTIRGGAATGIGGGILNLSSLILEGVLVTENTATDTGGGIWNLFGTLTLRAGTRVAHNASSVAGGIFNDRGGLIMETGSSLSGNSAIGGGGLFNGGTATLQSGSSVQDNWATGIGGGIHNAVDSTLILENGSAVRGNGRDGNGVIQTHLGGGIYNAAAGQVTLQSGSHVENNAVLDRGGGLYNEGAASIATTGILINNIPNDCASTNPVDNCSA